MDVLRDNNTYTIVEVDKNVGGVTLDRVVYNI